MHKALFLNLDNSVDYQKEVSFKLPVIHVDSILEAKMHFDSGEICALIIFTKKQNYQITLIVESFIEKVGCLPDHIHIVGDDPDPDFMNNLFEFGVEQFSFYEEWEITIRDSLEEIAEDLKSKDKILVNILRLNHILRKGEIEGIRSYIDHLQEPSQFNHLAAVTRARGLEAIGEFESAAEQLKDAEKLNKRFRPAKSDLANIYMIDGKLDEASDIYQNLDKTNPNFVNRKVKQAAIHLEKEEIQKAEKIIKDAKDLEPDSSKITEAQAQLHLKKGEIKQAFAILDQLDDVGPFFASKLNELGVKLSQSGKAKSALALYTKAHKIVKPELKYKISLNAALACRRIQDFEKSLRYLQRAKNEYGGEFEKQKKIEANVKALMKKGQEK